MNQTSSPRLRQTLDLLLSGRSEKEIAEQCGLAKSTVNEYVAALDERYGVNSRAELMARFIRWRETRRGDDSTSPSCPSSYRRRRHRRRIF